MSVLLLPPIFQFFDNNGDPLANGFVDTFAAGTTTRLATYTDSTGNTAAPNPIELNSAGRPTSGSGAIWGEGAYKFIVRDANGVQVGEPLDNVTSFTALANATNAYFQSFSGNGSQTVFTTSDDLGTEEKALMVFVAKGLEEIAVNGTFATDTEWTKGAGVTITGGKAVWTGAVSSALSQTPIITVVPGQAYAFTYTINRSAGGLIPSLGGQNGIERTASGTYREIIIAASSTPLAFTGNSFTGDLDNVSVTRADAQGYDILSPSAYTINGTSLTFASAPATGSSNIYVFAPSLLLGAASAAAGLAQIYAAQALASATSAAGFSNAKNQWNYSSTTSMADPSTGNIRFNNATLASASAAAISNFSANSGNPDLSMWVSTWDDSPGSNRGTLYVFKDNATFALYTISGGNTDNLGWKQLALTYLTGAGSFSNTDPLYIGFTANGSTTVTGGITALTGDVSASGSGSVVATLATVQVGKGGTGATSLTANNVLLGNGTSALQVVAPGTAGNALVSNGTTWASAAPLEVFSAIKTDTFGTSSSTYTDITGFSVTTNASTATDRFLVQVNLSHAGFSSVNDYGAAQLVRGATAIGIGTSVGSRLACTIGLPRVATSDSMAAASFAFIDTPGAAANTTYKVQVRGISGGVGINRSATDSDSSGFPRGISSIIVTKLPA